MNPETCETLRKAIQAQWESYQLGQLWTKTDSPERALSVWHQWKHARDDAEEKMKAAFQVLNLGTEP